MNAQRLTGDEDTTAAVVEAIASETQRPFDEVRRVYDSEFAQLSADARVTDYLVLFATRRTRAVLAASRR
jgi:hypothetical protein